MNVQSRIEIPRDLSIEAFFAWSEGQSDRYELVRGTPRVQPWVKRNHSKITSNISFLLQSKLDRDRFNVHHGDFAISTGPSTIRYADVLVEPGDAAGDARTAEHAILIVEVLSPSTASEDLGPKRIEYLGLQSLTDYVILAQDEVRAWHWTRLMDGSWPSEPTIVDAGTLRLGGLCIGLPLAEAYRGIVWPPKS